MQNVESFKMYNEFHKAQYLLWNQTVGEMAPEALVPQFPTDLNANDSAISVPATQGLSFWMLLTAVTQNQNYF